MFIYYVNTTANQYSFIKSTFNNEDAVGEYHQIDEA